MRKILLMSSALVLLSGTAEAACIQTPSCSSLGYSSSSSCSGGTKCPFGNYWNCTASDLSNKITEITNKITTLETKVNELSKDAATANCKIGDILYSDMSCNTNVVASKTPIGVIFDITNKLAVGLQESEQIWSANGFSSFSAILDIASEEKALNDKQGKTKTQIIFASGLIDRYPAANYAYNYKTEGTKVGDWYLPAMGELNELYINASIINLSLLKIGGTTLTKDYYWSSTIYDYDSVWSFSFYSGTCSYQGLIENPRYVRPVLAF